MTTIQQQLTCGSRELAVLRAMVASRTVSEGRTDTFCEGLRYYRFSQSIQYQKKQLLMPGIVVVLQGQKMAQLDRDTFIYNERNYLVLGTGSICKGTVVTASEHSPYLAIHLDLPVTLLVKVITNLADHKIETPKNAAANFTKEIDAFTLDALTRLVTATHSKLDALTIAPLVIEEIIIRLLRSSANTRLRDLAAISRSTIRVQESMNFMQAHLNDALTVAKLAQQAAMSPSHYSHCFREVTGVTPMRYLRDLRLEKSRIFLLYQGMRPNEAAYNAGFENIEHFNREFKRRYAKTPTQYIAEFTNI